MTMFSKQTKPAGEIDSWTVEWYAATVFGSYKRHKCFINPTFAKEYEDELKRCAEFIGITITSHIYKNE